MLFLKLLQQLVKSLNSFGQRRDSDGSRGEYHGPCGRQELDLPRLAPHLALDLAVDAPSPGGVLLAPTARGEEDSGLLPDLEVVQGADPEGDDQKNV